MVPEVSQTLHQLKRLHQDLGATIDLLEAGASYEGKKWKDVDKLPLGGNLLLPYIFQVFREWTTPYISIDSLCAEIEKMGVKTTRQNISAVVWRNRESLFQYGKKGWYTLAPAYRRGREVGYDKQA